MKLHTELACLEVETDDQSKRGGRAWCVLL